MRTKAAAHPPTSAQFAHWLPRPGMDGRMRKMRQNTLLSVVMTVVVVPSSMGYVACMHEAAGGGREREREGGGVTRGQEVK